MVRASEDVRLLVLSLVVDLECLEELPWDVLESLAVEVFVQHAEHPFYLVLHDLFQCTLMPPELLALVDWVSFDLIRIIGQATVRRLSIFYQHERRNLLGTYLRFVVRHLRPLNIAETASERAWNVCEGDTFALWLRSLRFSRYHVRRY